MCKIIAIANQKGGVAKTTTTINLGVGLSKVGKRVMLIDADPQGHLTMGLGFPKNLNTGSRDYLFRTRRLADRYGNRKNSSGRYKEYRCFFYCKSRSKTFRKWRMVRHNRKYGSIHLF